MHLQHKGNMTAFSTNRCRFYQSTNNTLHSNSRTTTHTHAGTQKEEDLYVRLIDSSTKQVRWSSLQWAAYFLSKLTLLDLVSDPRRMWDSLEGKQALIRVNYIHSVTTAPLCKPQTQSTGRDLCNLLHSRNAYVYKRVSTMGHLPLIHACTCSQQEHPIQDLVFI